MPTALQRYKAFHGKLPKRITKQKYHEPKKLVLLGEAHAIEYVTNKLNGGGDGKPAIYRHKFETPCKLYMDETGKKQLYILGNKLKVTSAGIEN
jgi:hypothetical protein